MTDTHLAERVPALRRRAELTARLRAFFEAEGFWEVDTPLWSRDTCVDAWIEPVACDIEAAGRGFLQTSPEFHLKRLLAAGADRVWQLTRSFRGGEAGPMHNPEFAILEWYAAGETHHDAMDRTQRLMRAVGIPGLPTGPIPRVGYYDAFAAACGERVEHHTAEELHTLALQLGVSVVGPLDRDGWLNAILAEVVEPQLAERPAVFLTDYPASQAALASVREGDPPVAERFELYVRGVELANGYNELTDADELERRFVRENVRRQRAGKPALPVASRLLDAMRQGEGLPACAGVAVGWDRVVMLAVEAASVRDVISFSIDSA